MAAHTPGPWLIGMNANGVLEIGPSSNCTVAKCYFPPVGTAEANARLIATAPDLLAALIKCRDEMAGLPHSLGYDFTHLPAIDAAIAKATQP